MPLSFFQGKVILEGGRRVVRTMMHQLAASLCLRGRRVLMIDSTNSLNPHHWAFSGMDQWKYFRRIYCVRTPLPFDLWARLKSAGSFVKNRKIDFILITSLSLVFRDGNIVEVVPMIDNILGEVEKINDVSVIVGNSPSQEEVGMFAYSVLSEKGGEKWDIRSIQ